MIKFTQILKEQRDKICWHASPELNITKLVGRYSSKFGEKGIFCSPSFASSLEDWAPWVAGKKSGNGRLSYSGYQYYQTLAIYKLSVPIDVYEECRKLHTQKAEEYAKKKGGGEVYGAFYWGPEIFIPDRLLDQVSIIGKEIKKYHEFMKQEKRAHNLGFEKRYYSSKGNIYLIAKMLKNNLAAKYYVELKNKLLNEKIMFTKEQLNKINNAFNRLSILFRHYKYNPRIGDEMVTIDILDEKNEEIAERMKNEIEELIKKANDDV